MILRSLFYLLLQFFFILLFWYFRRIILASQLLFSQQQLLPILPTGQKGWEGEVGMWTTRTLPNTSFLQWRTAKAVEEPFHQRRPTVEQKQRQRRRWSITDTMIRYGSRLLLKYYWLEIRQQRYSFRIGEVVHLALQ